MKMTEKILIVNRLREYMANPSLAPLDIYKEVSYVAKEISNSDRATFYIFNQERGLLESCIAQGLPTKLEIKLGEGIVGACGLHKEVILENDVDTTKDFNANVNLGSGYVTTNTLAIPMLNEKKELLGVIQVLNKKRLSYNETDEKLLLEISRLTSDYIQTKR